MKKPITISFTMYYKCVIKNLAHKIIQKIIRLYDCISGRWYCGFCHEYHSKRTLSFNYSDGFADNICSLGMENLKISYSSELNGGTLAKKHIFLNAKQIKTIFNIMEGAK